VFASAVRRNGTGLGVEPLDPEPSANIRDQYRYVVFRDVMGLEGFQLRQRGRGNLPENLVMNATGPNMKAFLLTAANCVYRLLLDWLCVLRRDSADMRSLKRTGCGVCFISLVLLTAGLLGLSVFAVTVEPDLKIAVNMTTIESFPLFAAVDSLSANGKADRIELLQAPNGRNAMAQLIGGAADAATGSETQALLNSVIDPRVRIVLTLSECRYRIIARRSAGIRRLSDLRGKRVGATANTSSHYYLSRMLAKARMREADIRLVSLEGQDMPVALEKHNVDAVSIWEPHAENSLRALGNDVVVFEDGSAYTEHFNLNTRTDVLADPAKRAALLAVIREVARASSRIRNRPAEMIPSLAPRIGFPQRTVFSVWRQFTFPSALNGGLGSTLIAVEPWVASGQKRQPRPDRELTALIDFSLAQQALAN